MKFQQLSAAAILCICFAVPVAVFAEDSRQNNVFPELIYDTYDNFDGWEIALSDPRILTINFSGPNSEPGYMDQASPDVSGMTIQPKLARQDVGTPFPDGTTGPITLTSSESQFGLWGVGPGRDESVQLEKGALYRLRVNLFTSLPDTEENGTLYIQLGDPYQMGAVTAGIGSPEYFSEGTRRLPKIGNVPMDYDVYLEPRDSGDAPLRVFMMDVSGNIGADVTINSVELRKGTRENLGTPTLLRNYGGPDFETATGEPPVPAAGRSDFTTEGGIPGVTLRRPSGLNSAVAVHGTIYSNVVIVEFPRATNVGDLRFDQYANVSFHQETPAGLNVDDLNTGLTLDSDKIYAFDVWASTSTPYFVMPHLLVRQSTDYTSFSSTAFCISSPGAAGLQTSPELIADTAAKRYSCIFAPNSPNADPRTSLSVGFLWIGPPPFELLGGSSIRIHRMTLMEFDP